jgi:hypothetical protein
MPSQRFVSPERWWRAAAAPVIAGWLGYGLSRSGAGLAGMILCWLVVAAGLGLAVLIARTHLTVTDEGLADHRLLRVVRVPWQRVAGFEVNRPGSVWGGFCVTVACRDGGRIDLLSTRAYSRIPSSRHLDEVHRICWTLEEAATNQAG